MFGQARQGAFAVDVEGAVTLLEIAAVFLCLIYVICHVLPKLGDGTLGEIPIRDDKKHGSKEQGKHGIVFPVRIVGKKTAPKGAMRFPGEIEEQGEDEAERNTKLALVKASKTVIANCLGLLGIAAPERM